MYWQFSANVVNDMIIGAPMATDKEIVVITGGNTGLGLEVVRKLLREHSARFHVIIGSRTHSKGEAAVQGLRDGGYDGVETIQIDVTDDASLATAARIIGEEYGRVDVLHVNVSIKYTRLTYIHITYTSIYACMCAYVCVSKAQVFVGRGSARLELHRSERVAVEETPDGFHGDQRRRRSGHRRALHPSSRES
jgi:NAD(P)-dependent dehydrogenase (short-subunit alcohol dehydrogenase family)